jgi:acyl CoA:acetate/3-ketoacid CoA transferase
MRDRFVAIEHAARPVPEGGVVSVSASSGLNTPDRMLAAIGDRIEREGAPRGITALLPIAAGGMCGIKGIDRLARKVVFSGYFRAAALELARGEVRIRKDGRLAKSVPRVEHVAFSKRRAREQKQDLTPVTGRCVMKRLDQGLTVTEIAPGVDLAREVLARAGIALKVAPGLGTMDERLFRGAPMGLAHQPRRRAR